MFYINGLSVKEIKVATKPILQSIESTEHPFKSQSIQLPSNVSAIHTHSMDAACQTILAQGSYSPLTQETRKIKIFLKNEKGHIVSTGKGRTACQIVYPDQLKCVIEIEEIMLETSKLINQFLPFTDNDKEY